MFVRESQSIVLTLQFEVAIVVSALAVLFEGYLRLCLVGLAISFSVAALATRHRPASALMELAAGIKGAPPAELTARAERIAAKRAVARPPPSQEEELQMLDTTATPRFEIDDARWLSHLDAEGYAVVASVADEAARGHAEDLLWQFLEKHTGWRRNAHGTWTDAEIERIGSVQNGIVNGAGMGQSDFLWYLRTLPKVKNVFAKIWGTENLLVSFDGANIFRPWHHGFRKTVCGWWHVDQGRAKVGRHAVQGLVSLFAADSSTGGLTVVPKSHLRFAEVTEDQQNPLQDYCTVQPYCPVLQELPRKLVTCQAGDLVLWDSRLIHANAPAVESPITPADRLLRAVGYVCMTPTSFASEEVLIGRRAAYEHRFSTSHWPHKLDLGTGSDEPPQCLKDAPANVKALIG
jgi:ectoine hydroxylase-related dioxygenase (phytanoyl-CoA dioxygenase family)